MTSNDTNKKVDSVLKFKPFNEYSWNMLDNLELWIPRADTLNDPFEAWVWYEEPFGGLTKKKLFQNVKTHQLDYFFTAFTSIEEWNNILLWAHYTSDSSGFAVEFSIDTRLWNKNLISTIKKDIDQPAVTNCFEVLSDVVKVNYENLIKLKPPLGAGETKEEKERVESNLELISKAWQTKNKVWEYEKEYRLLAKDNKGRYLVYPRQ